VLLAVRVAFLVVPVALEAVRFAVPVAFFFVVRFVVRFAVPVALRAVFLADPVAFLAVRFAVPVALRADFLAEPAAFLVVFLAVVFLAAVVRRVRFVGVPPLVALAAARRATPAAPSTNSWPASRARSRAEATTPLTRFPGGVSGERGWGRVGTTALARPMASPMSSSALRLRARRTFGKRSDSSSSTWWRTFSMSTVTLASKRSASGAMPSSSESSHLTTWCSSSDSSTMSSVGGTASRTAG
jgi:hypothetical protein